MPTDDWRELEPICRKLQAAGYTMVQLRTAWSSAARGRTTYLNVPDAAYATAKESGIEDIRVQLWGPHGGAYKPVKGTLVGLSPKVAYVEVVGLTVTFSLSHGGPCYGSQRKIRARLHPNDLARLSEKMVPLSPLEKALLEALDQPLRPSELQEKTSLPKSTIHHGLRSLLRRHLVTKSATTPRTFHR